MLYGFPANLVEHNWLHECMMQTLEIIFQNAQHGGARLIWPEAFPDEYLEDDEQGAVLRARDGLHSRLDDYQKAFLTLTPEQQIDLMQVVTQQNRIADLLACNCDCSSIAEQPEPIREPAKELFTFCFNLLRDIGVRDQHYERIIDNTSAQVCPFCGCEDFESPKLVREDYDHYLPKSKYPFAAVNFYNLVPMGGKCNRSYKKAQDFLKKVDGNRRRAFYPYSNIAVGISLEHSELFPDLDGNINWNVEFDPPSQETETWDEVFHLTERYIENFYQPRFASLSEDLRRWLKLGLKGRETTPLELLTDLVEYHEGADLEDKSFLKAAYFKALERRCINGDQDCLEFLTKIAA